MAMGGVPLGRAVEVRAQKSAKLINSGSAPMAVSLVPESPPNALEAPSGYEWAPNPHFLRGPRKPVVLPAESVQEAKLSVEIPDEARYRGRRWSFAVRARPPGTDLEREQIFMVLIETQGDQADAKRTQGENK